jgi:hypothetical protein
MPHHRNQAVQPLIADILGGDAMAAPASSEKPDLIIDGGDLPATARDLRDLLAQSGNLFDRGMPVKVVPRPDGGPATAIRLTANRVVFEAHSLSRPVKLMGEELVARVTRTEGTVFSA